MAGAQSGPAIDAPATGESGAGGSLRGALRELALDLRAGAADVADLVAAEAGVALRMLVAMVVAAVAGAVLGLFSLAGFAIAAASELVENGVSVSVAAAVIAVVCAAACVVLVMHLRRLVRKALFGHTRQHLRGHP